MAASYCWTATMTQCNFKKRRIASSVSAKALALKILSPRILASCVLAVSAINAAAATLELPRLEVRAQRLDLSQLSAIN
jgi:hypothetical protein